MENGLSSLNASRQILRAFGGLNETYGCSEAEWQESMNFSSRGYPALQTRKLRAKVIEQAHINGMYHLNGMILCVGKNLLHATDRWVMIGQDVQENVLEDSRKQMVGMGSKVLIWPDKKIYDTKTRTLADIGMHWELGDTEVTICPCDEEGMTYTLPAENGTGTAEPENPTTGQLFLKTDSTGWPYGSGCVLEQYDAKSGKWVQILLNRVKLTCPGIGGMIREGDTVTLGKLAHMESENFSLAGGYATYGTDCLAELNGDAAVQKVDGDSVILAGKSLNEEICYYGTWRIDKNTADWTALDGKKPYAWNCGWPGNAMTVERRVPEMDFITVHDNRVWGCSSKDNSIYASKLGDATNWYSYQGTAADSYAVSVGSEGAFTGAASCLGYMLFFKENCIHKLYGARPSDYQLSSVRCRGVAKNAGHSLCVIAETLYYLGTDGVMAWDGSLPQKVSSALDAEKLQDAQWTAAAGLDGRYYLYLQQSGSEKERLLVYDTETGLWQEESAAGREMMGTGWQLYLWDGTVVWAVEPDREKDGNLQQREVESSLAFEAVSGDIGLSVPDDKYISRVTLRVDAAAPSMVTLEVSCDGGPWETVGSSAADGSHVRLNFPFVPGRYDTLRLKLRGSGQIALRSMAFTLAAATGGRVSGAQPRR